MRGINIFIEYFLLVILVAISVFMVYSWFESNKGMITAFLISKDVERNIELIDKFLYNTEGLFNASMDIRINFKMKCFKNYTVFYTDKICNSNILENISYSGDIISINNSLYLYSENTGYYYEIFKTGSYIYSSCYENQESYIILSDYCEGFCENCLVEIGRNNGKIYVISK